MNRILTIAMIAAPMLASVSMQTMAARVDRVQPGALPTRTSTPGTFTVYQGRKAKDRRVEAVTDRGPILEMVINCDGGTAIISYSKLENKYCSPQLQCSPEINKIINLSCR